MSTGTPSLLRQRLTAAAIAMLGIVLAVAANFSAGLGAADLVTATLGFAAMYLAAAAAVVNSRRG